MNDDETHAPLSPAQQEEVLRMAGLSPEQAEHFATTTTVAEAVTDTVGDTFSVIASDLLAKAKGNLDTAKQLSERWAETEFDKVKLSKIQAAALGVDKSKHNKDEYRRIQGERERINSAMRKQTRGHVAAKISAKKTTTTGATNPALDAFLLANQGNALIEQYRALAAQGGES